MGLVELAKVRGFKLVSPGLFLIFPWDPLSDYDKVDPMERIFSDAPAGSYRTGEVIDGITLVEELIQEFYREYGDNNKTSAELEMEDIRDSSKWYWEVPKDWKGYKSKAVIITPEQSQPR